jgi:hypothetical protein
MTTVPSQPLDVEQDTQTPSGLKQLSVPLPLSPHTNLHIQITHSGSSTLAFLTTTDSLNPASLSSLGSLVYAMPNVRPSFILLHSLLPSYFQIFLTHEQRLQPNEPLSTALYTVPSSIDFATRTARIVARRTGKPTYIGCSVAFRNATVEEELAGVKAAVDGILNIIEDKPNGKDA